MEVGFGVFGGWGCSTGSLGSTNTGFPFSFFCCGFRFGKLFGKLLRVAHKSTWNLWLSGFWSMYGSESCLCVDAAQAWALLSTVCLLKFSIPWPGSPLLRCCPHCLQQLLQLTYHRVLLQELTWSPVFGS